MTNATNLNIRIDRDLKTKADRLFNDMGMSLTTAVNIFVRQAVLERAIPFKIHRDFEDTGALENIEKRRAAMQEIRELLSGIDGSKIDLAQSRAERRSDKYERTY
ncbi:MAG: type II toxin-antitoxin system RelB/DinJ family antitoxin [Clostridiales bacterium]|nr:type II toxin-antitoxin system RelB/DinJ family antitoxin [Clostridiales bacterium]